MAGNVVGGTPVLFRTYASPQNETSNGTIWEAARATSAIPMFFKSIKIDELGLQKVYIDGGISYNNPTGKVIEEAELIFPGRRIARIISIGAGVSSMASILRGNLFAPIDPIRAFITIAADCERMNDAMAQRLQSSPGVYFRFNVAQGLQNIQLAQWDQVDQVSPQTFAYHEMGGMDRRMEVAVNVILERRGVISLPAENYVIPFGTSGATT